MVSKTTFFFPNNSNGAEAPNPGGSGPSHPGDGPPEPPGPPDDGPNFPGRPGNGTPIPNNRTPQSIFPYPYYINVPNQHNSTDSNIKIMQSFKHLPKFNSLNKPWLIYDHIKQFVTHAQNIQVLNKEVPILLQMLWKTFNKVTANLLIPFNDINHPIYSKTLEEALTDIKNIFCDDFLRQTLRNHYQNFKYTKGDLRVFLVKK